MPINNRRVGRLVSLPQYSVFILVSTCEDRQKSIQYVRIEQLRIKP